MNKVCSKIFLVGSLFALMPLCAIAQIKDKPRMKAGVVQTREQRFVDLVQLEKFRKAGLAGDHSIVSSMIEALNSEARADRKLMALHALAQLGDDRALPNIQSLIESATNTDQRNFARAAEARLVAEKYGSSIADINSRQAAKVARFFQDLGMPPAELNADLASYHTSLRPIPAGKNRYYSSGSIPPPAGVYAIRELADMLYHDRCPDYSGLPEAMHVNFAGDPPSALKIRLAPLSQEERLRTMIDELANKNVMLDSDDYEIQLASNEGILASHAAAAKIREMMQQPDRYSRAGFISLVWVIWGTGDREQAQLVKELGDKGLVSSSPMIYWDLVNGIPRGRVVAY